MNVGEQGQSYKEVVAEREKLLTTVIAHEQSLAAKEVEFVQHQELLNSTQARLTELLEARIGDTRNDDASERNLQIQMAELHSEREQRLQIETLLAEEKRQRIASEEKFATADSEWKALITEVDVEMKSSHGIIEALQESKKTLSKELDSLKKEKSLTAVTSASTTVVRDLENRLVQSFADTRKAHIMIQEQKASPGFSIRVFANVSDPIIKDAPALVTPNADHISLHLKDIDGSENTSARKFIFDKVYTPSSQDKLLDSLDEYIKHAVKGKQTSIISHGKTTSKKTELLFGAASGSEGKSVVQVVFTSLSSQLKKLGVEGGWTYDVRVSFVRILDEDILDLFCAGREEESNKTHEIKRTSDGSTIITNLEAIDVDIQDEREVQSVVNHTLVARHVHSENTSGAASSIEAWHQDCIQSHFVVIVAIKGTHNETGQVVEGKLSFVELAGDDDEEVQDEGIDAKTNGNTNISITKTKSKTKTITTNKSSRSMQCFNDIITSISKRQGHIPYRNTKITYILQPSFSPSGKSLLIFGFNRDQSYASAFKALQFANRVFQCTISPLINQSGGSGTGSSGGALGGGGGSRPGSVRRLKDEKARPKMKPSLPVSSRK